MREISEAVEIDNQKFRIKSHFQEVSASPSFHKRGANLGSLFHVQWRCPSVSESPSNGKRSIYSGYEYLRTGVDIL